MTREPASQHRIINALRRNLVAWLALFFALTGTGLAASRYVITSISQIKPSVLRQLRGGNGVASVAGTPKGPKAIIDRIHSAGPYTTVSEPVEGPYERPAVPLTGGTWTQAPEQADVIFGQATITAPSEAHCSEGGGGAAFLEVLIDGSNGGTVYVRARPTESTETYIFEWSRGDTIQTEGATTWFAETGTATPHTITARASDDCRGGGHFKIDSVDIDVMGLR